MPTSTVSTLNAPTDSTGVAQNRFAQPATATTGLLALGIVYGDLGTSPLYTLQTIVHFMGDQFTPEAALGSLSLIFWALIITISIKYCFFVMRADNQGEGGILALMTMTDARWFGRGRWLIIAGLFGAALIYGDGIITPAISVLSAVEGLNVATSIFKPYTMPFAVVILVGLFAIQSRGTGAVGKTFGPVMFVWFATIAILGVIGIVHHPHVLAATNPVYGAQLVMNHGFLGFTVLGGVFLALTGGKRFTLTWVTSGETQSALPGIASCCRLSSLITLVRSVISWKHLTWKQTRFSNSHPIGRFIHWLHLQRLPPSSPAKPSLPVRSP